MLDKIFPKIHSEGYKFLVIFSVLTVILYLIHGFLGLIGFVLTIWVYYFFRDPDRISIEDDNYLTSPADGLVLQVIETVGPKELGLENKKFTKVSIFMNVFDCHVNRSPCSGKNGCGKRKLPCYPSDIRSGNLAEPASDRFSIASAVGQRPCAHAE